MDNETTPYRIQGSRVYGNGQSFNCTNKVTAQDLCNTLNQYQKCTTEYEAIEKKLDRIQKTIISLQMSTSIMSNELQKLHEEVIQ